MANYSFRLARKVHDSRLNTQYIQEIPDQMFLKIWITDLKKNSLIWYMCFDCYIVKLCDGMASNYALGDLRSIICYTTF